MTEYRFESGVIIELPAGFELVDATTLCDPLPRKLVVADYEAKTFRQTHANTVGKDSD